MLRNLRCLFETYGIEYSDPMIQDTSRPVDVVKNYILDFREYKYISRHQTLEEANETDDINGTHRSFIYMSIYFNLPKVQSYISACKFISNVMKCFWRKLYGLYFERFWIWSVDMKLYTNILQYDYMEHRLSKAKYTHSLMTIVRSINIFFPEKDKETILNELNSDSGFCKKIVKCFP